MGEMETFAVYYIINMAAKMLRGSSVGAFLYRSIGEPRVTSLITVEQIFALAGFRKLQCGPTTIQTLAPITVPAMPSLIGNGASPQVARDFFKIDETKLLESYAYFDFMGLGNALATLRNKTENALDGRTGERHALRGLPGRIALAISGIRATLRSEARKKQP